MAGVRQFDEQQALGKALEVFSTRGFRATSMLDLAAGTGVQRGSLYNAYGGKEAIFLHAFRRYAGEFLVGATEALRQGDRRSGLTAFFAFCIKAFTSGSPSRGCLSTRTAIDAGTEAPEVESAVRAFLDSLEAVVHDALAGTGDRRHLSVDPHRAARLVVTMTRGLAVMERVRYDPVELTEIADSFVATLFHG